MKIEDKRKENADSLIGIGDVIELTDSNYKSQLGMIIATSSVKDDALFGVVNTHGIMIEQANSNVWFESFNELVRAFAKDYKIKKINAALVIKS